jgi:hypothetical protein
MLASALVAYMFGPALGFAFALVVGTICGLTFAMSVTGRGAELESRALVRLGPLVDRIHARAQRIVGRIAHRTTPEGDEVIELGDLDLELGTNP